MSRAALLSVAVPFCSILTMTAARAEDPAVPQNISTAASAGQTGGQGFPDIVVTAGRREEPISRSSLVVDAVGGEDLRRAEISRASDLNGLVPGLEVATQGSATQVYIRGVGDFSANPLSGPGVAFSVDGINVGRPEGIAANFHDLARLEVVKGPQGTLYGRNASGGAINLITNVPKLDRVESAVTATVGNYSLLAIDGSINLPLGPAVAIRAAVNRVRRDGYLRDGTDDDDQLAGRVKLLIEPGGDVSLLLSLDGARVRGHGPGYVFLPRQQGADAWEGTSSAAGNAYLTSSNPLISPSGPPPRIHNDYANASAQLIWRLGFATLTIIPAWRHIANDSLVYNAQSLRVRGHDDQETFEARLASDTSALKWVAGLYYFHEHNPGEVDVLVGPALLKSRPVYDPRGTSYAAYGEATVPLTQRFRAIAGARYTTEERSLAGDFFLYPNGGATAMSIERFDGQKRFGSAT